MKATSTVKIAANVIAMALASSLPLDAATTKNPSQFRIARGTNVSHWLSQDFNWGPKDRYITEADIQFISELGFDHIRLPIDEHEMWAEDGGEIASAFNYLDQCIRWCSKRGLRVVVDLHTVRAHHFNAVHEGGKNSLFSDDKAQEQVIGLWRKLGAHLRHFDNSQVAYELLNEPTAPEDSQWNKLAMRMIAAIRETEPNRVIVVGANQWQIPSAVPHLELPKGDPNLIISVHYYTPMVLTHYRAHWTPLRTFKGKVHYPGEIVDKKTFDKQMKNPDPSYRHFFESAALNWGPDRFRADFAEALAIAKAASLDLYCGEFGCMDTVEASSRLAYYRDLVGVFNANSIAWANWDYKSKAAFGVVDWTGEGKFGGRIDHGLVNALLGNTPQQPNSP